MSPAARNVVRALLSFLAYGLVAALVAAPIAAERAIEDARFPDRLGTLPVEVSLAHNGVSTLDTGILGRLYWDRTGTGGFGAVIRATGPPEAGGTLSSYVSPRFVRANAAFVDEPGEVARVYGDQLRAELRRSFLVFEVGAFVLGGLVLSIAFRARAPFPARLRRRTRTLLGIGVLGAGVAASFGVALWLFGRWDGSVEPETVHPMPGVDQLAFSSPQTLEVARQVQPFIEKNTDRIRERSEAYEATATATLRTELSEHTAGLRPAPGETVVIAEADPQGSRVGTAARTSMYALLQEYVGEDAFAVRTISGDITSNGTLAEEGFVEAEARASGDIPTAVVKGDHDTETTVEQLTGNDVINPEFDVTEVGGLEVVAANDPAFKALFGGLVINESGISETELGENLREELDSSEAGGSLVVLFHQPRSAAGYIGIGATSELDTALGRETVPWDDGIPDLPPGIINIGHLHDAAPPKVIWNTDGDEITWTVLNQLGTAGGVEENPTFNRFSTPFSVPLKTVSVQLQYVNAETGLQTGYASIELATDGTATVTDRTDLGLPS